MVEVIEFPIFASKILLIFPCNSFNGSGPEAKPPKPFHLFIDLFI